MSALIVMKKTFPVIRPLLVVIAALYAIPSAWGWGCKGHEIVALIAEAHLTPRARAMAFKILADGPISPTLSRYCKEPDLDAFVDSSTWADDERTVLPDTAPWHFIDIPRGARESTISEYCPPATSCITAALASQLVNSPRFKRDGSGPRRCPPIHNPFRRRHSPAPARHNK